MKTIETVEALEALYGTPGSASLVKVAKRMTPMYRKWIMSSKFCVLTTVGKDGSDGSPRGDDGPVVRELDPGTLAMPDWHGNNRIDSLRNIVEDGRASLMFMVPHSASVVRVNGRAAITADPDLLTSFERDARHPRSVILFHIEEIYFQCARAILRAGLWDANADDPSAPHHDLPSAGDLLSEQTDGAEGGEPYDKEWPGRAKSSMW